MGTTETTPAAAQDTVKVAIGQRGSWSTAVVELGQRAGFFKKKDITADILYTSGGGETIQAVISGAVDVGVALGTASVMGAFSKGAPIRIIGGAFTGATDTLWYVPSSSSIHTLKDIKGGKTIAFSSVGSSTHLYALSAINEFKLDARAVATGSLTSTFTQTMSGQVDVGWSAPPVGLKEDEEGKIRIIGSGAELPAYRNQTMRVLGTNVMALEQRRDVLLRFMQAYRDTIEWLYASPEGVKMFAADTKIPESIALRTRDEFLPKSGMLADRVEGFEGLTKDAIAFKFLNSPLSPEQLKTLVQVPFK